MRKDFLHKMLHDRKILQIEFYVILGLLVLLFLLSGMHRKKNTEAVADGEAYIAEEMRKDPAETLARIAARGELAPGPSLQTIPDNSATDENLATDGNLPAAGDEMTEGTLAPDNNLAPDPSFANFSDNLTPEDLAFYQQRYANTLVIGDSMAQAVYEYGLLDGNHVYFERGASISMLSEEIDEAMAMLPSKVIFFTGLNDTDYFADPNAYAAAYQDRVNQVLSWNPAVEVYICSMTPPADWLGAAREDLARAPEYDAALQALCASTTSQYIDLNWMVQPDLYLEDGIHFNEYFYTVWLQYAAMKLNI